MIVFGAIDFVAAVVRIGKFLGYHVTVCDARPAFTSRRRFPDADEVVVRWPHDYLASIEVDARVVLCVLTHNPKLDAPLRIEALRSPATYIGAMGSCATHDDRVTRLREAGVSEAKLACLSSPIGLDLGAGTRRRPRSPSLPTSSPSPGAAPAAPRRPRGPDPPLTHEWLADDH